MKRSGSRVETTRLQSTFPALSVQATSAPDDDNGLVLPREHKGVHYAIPPPPMLDEGYVLLENPAHVNNTDMLVG